MCVVHVLVQPVGDIYILSVIVLVLLQPSVSGRDAEQVRGVEPERLKGLAWWGWNGLVGFDLLRFFLFYI